MPERGRGWENINVSMTKQSGWPVLGLVLALILPLPLPVPLAAQANSGELRLTVTDPTGLAVTAAVAISSQANQYQKTLTTTPEGTLDVPGLPYGVYAVAITHAGFAPLVKAVEIRTSTPTQITAQLNLAASSQTVTVTAPETLINPAQAGAVARIGSITLQSRLSALPGRSLQSLINSQPGWLYEGNAVLHPRGSEYQTQFVIDGVPIQGNSSPGLGPELEAADVSSISIYTAGIPAEYGRKLGGVVEINTIDDTRPGFHGKMSLSGGSFDTRGAFFEGEYTAGKNTLGFSADGSGTAHYLNPVVPQNYTNLGTTGDFSLNFARRISPNNQVTLSLRHELSRFDQPNELVQQAAGQHQNADNYDTMGIAAYEHVFSAHMVGAVHAMWRDGSNDFFSNPQSTPVMITQHNAQREGYANASLTFDLGHQEWMVGGETDNTFLHENLAYHITDPSQYDPGTPVLFAFAGRHPDLEQSAYAQDLIHLGNWTVNAGLRWDHYDLLVKRQAVSPRLSIARYFPEADMTLHFSYDRIFQTPSSDNILLSASSQVESIAPGAFFRLPVEPSLGNYYEGGMSKGLYGKMRLNLNYYRRAEKNFADDNQLNNTSISFPIAFDRAVIYGAEAQLTLPAGHRWSGDLSYSYMVGTTWLPVTGGLFLGADASGLSTSTGEFPDSQDQRNTFRGRLRYQLTSRLWLAGGAEYNSGLPFAFNGDATTALAEYGPQVISRVNFDRGRLYPTTLVNASFGAQLWSSDRYTVNLQADGQNLTNVLDVIDFGGLFSGNAIGPSRSVSVRLSTSF